MTDFHQYEQLQKKIELFFEKVHAKHFDKIQCRKGCHSCCKPDLSISIVEKDYIEQKLVASPDRLREIRKNEQLNPHKSQRCSFLSEDGTCLIYQERPLICRSHGIPIQAKEENQVLRDVCELNFTNIDLNTLNTDDILNIDTLNTILAVLNMQLYKEKSEIRFSLTPSAIFSEE